MENLKIIEKVKGMEKWAAIELLKYHQELQELKKRRLYRQIENTVNVVDAIGKEIVRREKEGET